jgi:hypothetical protein
VLFILCRYRLPEALLCFNDAGEIPLLNSGEPADPRRAASTPAEFCGVPASQCAVIALTRDYRHYKAVICGERKPFTFTPRSYSFFLLNVELTVGHRVLYPMRSHWEDVDFNETCERTGLAVVKCNTIFHVKTDVSRFHTHSFFRLQFQSMSFAFVIF